MHVANVSRPRSARITAALVSTLFTLVVVAGIVAGMTTSTDRTAPIKVAGAVTGTVRGGA